MVLYGYDPIYSAMARATVQQYGSQNSGACATEIRNWTTSTLCAHPCVRACVRASSIRSHRSCLRRYELGATIDELSADLRARARARACTHALMRVGVRARTRV